jgi:ABC-type Fe3+-siderophore transport system permease subunit
MQKLSMITKQERNNLILSSISTISLIAALALNYFRTEIFGVVKGYAPHNFSFNMVYFFPLLFSGFLTAVISALWLAMKWNARQNKNIKWLTLVLTFPAILAFFGLIISALSIFRNPYY